MVPPYVFFVLWIVPVPTSCPQVLCSVLSLIHAVSETYQAFNFIMFSIFSTSDCFFFSVLISELSSFFIAFAAFLISSSCFVFPHSGITDRLPFIPTWHLPKFYEFTPWLSGLHCIAFFCPLSYLLSPKSRFSKAYNNACFSSTYPKTGKMQRRWCQCKNDTKFPGAFHIFQNPTTGETLGLRGKPFVIVLNGRVKLPPKRLCLCPWICAALSLLLTGLQLLIGCPCSGGWLHSHAHVRSAN